MPRRLSASDMIQMADAEPERMAVPAERASLGPPPAYPGMRIGLLGGSFNPPHPGHRHIAITALRRLNLDRVWLIVTPGNPIKDHGALADLSERLAATRKMMSHPRIAVTGFEAALGTAYTARTLDFLSRRFPEVNFIWIMGGDNLAGFHRWQEWPRILQSMPVAVLDRPGFRFRAMASPAAVMFRSARVDETQAGALAQIPPPAWAYLTIPLTDISSTELRTQRGMANTTGEGAGD